jgi:hypothetical protein
MNMKESKGSKSSSTEGAVNELNRLQKVIGWDMDRLPFTHPNVKGKRFVGYVLGIVADDGYLHTIHPSDTRLAANMLERMADEIAGKMEPKGEGEKGAEEGNKKP